MRALAGVVLRRELLRLARRKQTWIVRVGYAAMLLGTCGYLMADQIVRTTDPTALQYIGNQLFNLYVGIQLFAVVVLAPVLVAAGVQEEKEAKTLDLMALTGVSAGRILWDQISSRLFALFAVVIAGTPFLAALNTFGGFGQMEMVNAILSTLAVGVILGSFAGFAALVSRGGPIAPIAFTIPYAMVIFTFPPILMALLVDERSIPLVSPIFGVYWDDPGALLATAIWVPALWSGWKLAVPVFRIMSGGDEHDDGFGLLSPDIWAVERFKKHTWGWFVLFGLCLIASWLNYQVGMRGTPMFVIGWVTCGVFFTLIHRTALISTLLLSERIEDLVKAPIKLWRRYDLEPRKVWRLPIVWREVVTRTNGTARALPVVFGALWVGFVAMGAALEGLDDTELRLILAAMAGTAGFIVAPMVATATMLDERRRKTLMLLFLTPLKPLQIARQKTISPVLFAIPLFAMGMLLWATAPDIPEYRAHRMSSMDMRIYSHEFGPNLLRGVPGIGTLAWLAWQLLVAGNLALVAASIAAWVKNYRLAWAAALMGAFLFASWPIVVAVALDVFDQRAWIRSLQDVAYVWWPLLDTNAAMCTLGGIPGTLALGLVVQAILMAIGWQVLARTLRNAAE